ncbi:MAG: alpha/beta hydrolase [Bacteroidota bacterium]
MKDKMLLLHGALGSQNQFTSLKEVLDEFYEVHTLNFEGHGGIASTQKFSINLFTQNVIGFLEEHAITEVQIFGYSMGGYVALNTALRIPEKIKKIITLGTKFRWDIASAQREVTMLNPDKIEEKVPHFADKLRLEHHPQDWKGVMRKTAQMMIDMGNGAKIQDDDFRKIDVGVVIGVGSLDNMVSYEESEYVTSLIPNAKLVELEGVKHPIDKVGVDVLVDYIRAH